MVADVSLCRLPGSNMVSYYVIIIYICIYMYILVYMYTYDRVTSICIDLSNIILFVFAVVFVQTKHETLLIVLYFNIFLCIINNIL